MPHVDPAPIDKEGRLGFVCHHQQLLDDAAETHTLTPFRTHGFIGADGPAGLIKGKNPETLAALRADLVNILIDFFHHGLNMAGFLSGLRRSGSEFEAGRLRGYRHFDLQARLAQIFRPGAGHHVRLDAAGILAGKIRRGFEVLFGAN